MLTYSAVLAFLRDLLRLDDQPSQSQHWILLAQSRDQQIPYMDHPNGHDPDRAFRANLVLRFPVPMRPHQIILDSGASRWNLLGHQCPRRSGFRHLRSQRDRRLDFRIASILDCERFANSHASETPRGRIARFRRCWVHRDCCSLALRSHAEA